MNLGPIYYPIIYTGHYGPMSQDGKNGLIGIFILLNIILVITILIVSIQWVIERRKDNPYKYNWFDFVTDSWVMIFAVIMGGIDAITLLCWAGYILGNAIL